jgi:DNA-binding IclR family transcriptional regulator
MANSAKEQLDALRRQVDRDAPLSPEPLLADAAQQGRQAASLMRELVGEQTAGLAESIRDRPLTAIMLATLGGYVLARIGRWL